MISLNPAMMEQLLEECMKSAAGIDNNSDNRDGTEENGNPEEKQEEPVVGESDVNNPT